MTSRIIEVPDFNYSDFYYPDILRSLIIFNRLFAPEITSEDDREPFMQLLKSSALVGHLNNVNSDIIANEALFGTARLLESVKNHLSLIGVKLEQNKPANADVILELSKIFLILTNIVPTNTQFATEETENTPQIIYEANEDNIIDQTDRFTHIFQKDGSTFGANRAGEAATDNVIFPMFDTSPAQLNDMLYVGHTSIICDAIGFIFDTVASNLKGVWEYYNGTVDDARPNLVTNLGPNLRFDLDTLLGTEDRKGVEITVIFTPTGAQEKILSTYSGGKNIIETTGLLGQSSVSTDNDDYTVGSEWNPLSDVVDGTNNNEQDGIYNYTLPQNESQDFIKSVINGVEAKWLRFRIIEHTGTMPIIDRIKIDDGKQYILVKTTQGESVSDVPLGSSDAGANQEFVLGSEPIIENTLSVEVDEGGGFTEWSLVENFLNSTNISKDYVLNVAADDTATIKFGNSTHGKIPSSGVDNIRAYYRIGADMNGNVGANTININKGGIAFVNRVFNPRQATGWEQKEGSTPADIERLKISGPATLRTRNRGITPDDIEFLSTEYKTDSGSGLIERSKTIEETFGVKTIEIVVVGIGGALLTQEEKEDVQNYFNGNKPLGIDGVLVTNHEVTAVNYTRKIIDVEAEVTGGNAAEIKNAITALLSPISKFTIGCDEVESATYRWNFGDEVPMSTIISEIQNVDARNIKKINLISPSIDTVLDTRELPFVGTVTITVV